jgi:predicted enzyme related to lactoylglutathione lyase
MGVDFLIIQTIIVLYKLKGEKMSLFKNVQLVSYHVQDWQKAKKFYQETLEWPSVFISDDVGWMEFGRENEAHIAISLWRGPGPIPPKKGGGMAVLTVDDAKKVTTALRARGVKCDDVVEIPGMVIYGVFYDPEGNAIQFASDASI